MILQGPQQLITLSISSQGFLLSRVKNVTYPWLWLGIESFLSSMLLATKKFFVSRASAKAPRRESTTSKNNNKLIHGRLYRWTENSFPFFLYLKPVKQSTLMLVKATNMRRELQSQNCVDGDYEKTTGPIYLKF